jgi:hypothetical protein
LAKSRRQFTPQRYVPDLEAGNIKSVKEARRSSSYFFCSAPSVSTEWVISRVYACPTIAATGQLSDNADTQPTGDGQASTYLATAQPQSVCDESTDDVIDPYEHWTSNSAVDAR